MSSVAPPISPIKPLTALPEPPSIHSALPTVSGHNGRWALLASLAVVVAGGLGWWYWSAGSGTVFQFAQLTRGPISATVSATGACNAVVDVQVGSQVSGNIKTLYADFNTHVKAGQLVALIDPALFEARVQQAQASLRHAQSAVENAHAGVARAEADVAAAQAAEATQSAVIGKAKAAVADSKAKLARRESMFTDKILAREELDTARTATDQAVADQTSSEAQRDAALHNVEAAQAALTAARRNVDMLEAEVGIENATLSQARIDLEHTRILAPVDGTVIARRMDTGQTVAASFQAPTIFEIAQDLTRMQVDTNVAEADIGRLQLGQRATFVVDAYPGQVFAGTVTQIRQAPINVQNVITYDAVLQVPNPELKLFPGMTANVSILVQRTENALKLPNSAMRVKLPAALVEGAPPAARPGVGRAVVYVAAKSGKATAVTLKTGISDGNFTEILEGPLQQGQSVITAVTLPGAAPAKTAPTPRGF